MIILNKLKITKILTDHYDTFGLYKTGKKRLEEFLLFIIVPIILGYFMFSAFENISDPLINILLTVFSIFVGLLLNLLVLILSLAKKDTLPESASDDKKIKAVIRPDLLREIFANISYTILLSISIILILLSAWINNPIIKNIFSFILYAFCIHFFMTLLMILKKMHILLFEEL